MHQGNRQILHVYYLLYETLPNPLQGDSRPPADVGLLMLGPLLLLQAEQPGTERSKAHAGNLWHGEPHHSCKLERENMGQ